MRRALWEMLSSRALVRKEGLWPSSLGRVLSVVFPVLATHQPVEEQQMFPLVRHNGEQRIEV